MFDQVPVSEICKKLLKLNNDKAMNPTLKTGKRSELIPHQRKTYSIRKDVQSLVLRELQIKREDTTSQIIEWLKFQNWDDTNL